MSLINDALKRAKKAQQENPPATPPLEFRAADSESRQNPRTTLLLMGLSLVIIALLGLAGILVWYVSQTKTVPQPVSARVNDAPLAPLPHRAPAPVSITTATNFAEPAKARPISEIIDNPEEPNTNGVPVSANISEAVKPAALKLQGIFFNPNAPSVVVNGRTIYLGDRVGSFRLLAVSPVSATFASATETNVLSLSDQ